VKSVQSSDFAADLSTAQDKVYILVLNWNNWRDTIECLESVFQNNYRNYQVVCIDNASTDDSEHRIKEWAAGNHKVMSRYVCFNTDNKPIPVVTYDRKTGAESSGTERDLSLKEQREPLIFMRMERNAGYAGGNNAGIRYVLEKGDGPFIWILNNDTVIEKDALAALVKNAALDAAVGMIGSKLLSYADPNVLQAAGGGRIFPALGNTKLVANNQEDNGRWDEPLELDYICGASLFVRRAVIEEIGLMDERYFLYWEDADWGMRAKRKGYKLLYCPESRVWHKEGGTSGGISPLTDYYWTRNGLLFAKKLYPIFLPFIPLSYLLKYTIVRMVKRQPLNIVSFLSGIVDFCKGKTGQ
jgi:GT2 family glycosyltransferase